MCEGEWCEENELLPFHFAASFEEESTAEQVYAQLQKIIRNNRCDLSIRKCMRANVLFLPWYVVVLGNCPTVGIRRKLLKALSIGTDTTIPEDELIPMMIRSGYDWPPQIAPEPIREYVIELKVIGIDTLRELREERVKAEVESEWQIISQAVQLQWDWDLRYKIR